MIHLPAIGRRFRSGIVCGLLGLWSAVAASAGSELIITNARVFDGRNAQLHENAEIVIAGGKIVAIRKAGSGLPEAGSTAAGADASRDAKAGSASAAGSAPRVIDAGNRIVIPGLIDAHVHPAMAIQIGALRDSDPNYVAARSVVEAQHILMRGFTTIRDMGGPVFGLKQAIDEDLLPGPRIFPSGAIISQTSGHGDFRPRSGTARRWSGEVDLGERLGYGLIADGSDEVATAVREQLRVGASQIKLAAGGGISSMYDPIDSVQYFEEELRAAVRAAADWGTYVAVHAYTPAAIRRSVEAGVRSIEHAHLIDDATMKLIAERGAFLSPQAYLFSRAMPPPAGGGATAAAGSSSPAAGPALTPSQAAQRDKAMLVGAGLDRMMQLAKKHGVKIAFGTDVFGSPRAFGLESLEFGVRLRWFTSLEILRQATSINGELLALSGPRNPYAGGKLGVLEPGAWADLLVVDGNPLEDIRVLEQPDRSLRLIVKNGQVVANRLD
ncbi:MAG: amidohydrolase family protein [Steroidobacteraceae bacterium]|nr:amidohydrolase family protein [Nevskiaceae bacterium]MCP5339340.1 amidohydrolase family protein [Nevskiaceae bacterium]MCP5471379.1 amidohydrolase family protein [Nevskiaceae bacterium]